MTKPLRIAIVAGEKSGDNLGASLISALKSQYPQCSFEGIGGDAMIEQGLTSLFDMERLAVMGFVEPLGRLPELLRMKRELIDRFRANPPDVFIGIDSPGFNLRVERPLKELGIPTVHYVSPSVWAYGEKRIHKIKKAVDLMLTLFPFETAIYDKYGIEVFCVGHPLADSIAINEAGQNEVGQPSPESLAQQNDSKADHTIALLPGSRGSEVQKLAPTFLAAAVASLDRYPGLRFVVPCANSQRLQQVRGLLDEALHGAKPEFARNFILLDGQSQHAMRDADFVILASGTATLEALLLRRPMVVCYKLAPVTYFFASRMLKVPYISLPNLLAGKKLIPEYIQDAVTVSNLQHEIQQFVERSQPAADDEDLASDPAVDRGGYQELRAEFHRIHRQLSVNASAVAAAKILDFVVKR